MLKRKLAKHAMAEEDVVYPIVHNQTAETTESKHLYDEHGLGECATEAFADETIVRLTEAFRSRGIRVDPLDNWEPLLRL